MIRFIIITLLSMFLLELTAQTIVFQENFETTPLAFTSDTINGHTWEINTRVQSQGLKCDSASVAYGDTIYLTSTAFSTINNSIVFLSFDHICKLEFADGGIIEVSNNNGATWTKLTGGYYLNATGQFGLIGNRFNASSYGIDWDFTNNNTPPQNSWWKRETFNISTLVGNSAAVKIRFGIADMNTNGSMGNAGWFLDSIIVKASPSELVPPTINLISPIIQDTTYTSDPFKIRASISDLSGIDTAMCIYSVSPNNFIDTIAMVYDNTTVDSFYCNIPFYGYGRSISYYVKAIDASGSHNINTTATHHFYCKHSTGGTVTIGTGNTTKGFPFHTYFNDSRTQILYTAAEINAQGINGGSISSIAFNVANASSQNMNGFSIKMQNYSGINISSTVINNWVSVYSTTNSIINTGWKTYNLTTPFTWNSSNNLLIEICFDNTTHSNNSNIYCTTAYGKVLHQHTDYNTGCNLTALTSQNYRPNIKINFAGGNAVNNDIGVNAILNPNGITGVVAGQNLPVNITLKNFGIDTVTSANIAWKYDGIIQTPISFTNSLKADSISTIICLDTINPSAGAHHILAWTENPNGIADYNINNDSSSVDFFACSNSLSGSYTIGGAGGDFATFSDAALALSMCGISGAVTFNIASGIYNEHINLNSINGVSSTNTITFQSASGDSSTVILTYDAASTNDNYVVKLNGAPYIIFKNMSFKATNTIYSRVFVFGNGNHDINITNNIIESTIQSTANNSNMALIWCEDSLGSNLQINNNNIINGSYAISLLGNNYASNWSINNNIIHGNYAKGIYIKNGDSVLINNNDIKADTLSSVLDYCGIFVEHLSGLCNFRKNNIITTNTSSANGIKVSKCNFVSSSPSTIANNIIQLKGNTTNINVTGGIYIYKSKNVNIYYNSIRISGNQYKSTAMALMNIINATTGNIDIANNIFTNQAGGYIYYINSVDTSKFSSHHNNLWNYGISVNFAYNNGDLSNLTAWVNTSGEYNSVSFNPNFATAYDLHCHNNMLNGIGIPIIGITTDYEGDTRNATTPDIGADEFIPSPIDAAAVELIAPIKACGLTSTENVVFKIKNVGNNSINGNFALKYKLKQSSTIVSENITTVIASGDSLTYTFTTTLDLDVTTYGKDSLFELIAWTNLTNDNYTTNDTAFLKIESKYQPLTPITTDITLAYGSSPTITATSTDSLIWYQYDTSTVELAKANSYNTGTLTDTTTFWVEAIAKSSIIKITETIQDKIAYGHTNPYPAYLPLGDFDGVEISNMSAWVADISAYSIYVQIGSIIYNYTFPNGTKIQPGNVLLAIYGNGLSVGPAGNNVFIINATSNVSSNTQVTYWIKDVYGKIIDAFASNGGSFSIASGVTNTDFSGTITGGSGHAGMVRIVADNNLAADWDLTSPAVASFGTYNPQLPSSISNNSCKSARASLTININAFPNNDAGISTFVNPQANVSANSQQIIKAELSNYGTTTLTTVDIAWQIDGVLQDTIHYNGALTLSSKDTITLDTIPFIGGTHMIKAWTFNPNNTADLYNFNDTSCINFNACLGGTYTIGAGTMYDFQSFTSALNTIQQSGACNHIIFNVAPGTYNEKLIIPNNNISSNSTITFQAANGDSTSVILTNNISGSSDNYTLKLDGANYFRFKNMTITTSVTSGYQGVIEINGGSAHNLFQNCVIKSGTINSINSRCIYSDNGNDNNNVFINNHILNGYYSIYFKGTNISSLEEGTIIENNIIEGFYKTGIDVQYQNGIIIKGNHIKNSPLTTLGYGIFAHYCDNNFKIIGNTINLTPVSQANGIRLYYCDGFTNNRGLIANNMISITSGNSTQYGINIFYSEKFDFVYNSINITSGNVLSQCIYLYTSPTAAINIINNIFRDSIGFTIYAGNTLGIITCDYNDYYSPMVNFAYWNGNISSLSLLQTTSSKDNHSLMLDPDFYSNYNLHLVSTSLSELATPINVVNVDIDGALRSSTSPTIGADEVDIIPFDIGITNIYNVPNLSSEFQSITPSITVKNFGSDTVSAFVISYSVNGGTSITQNYNISLVPGDTTFITLSSFLSPAGNSQICISTVLAADSNTINDNRCKAFYGNPAKDALVFNISKLKKGCSLTTDTIKLWVKNNGTYSINSPSASTITMNYQVGNSTPVSQNFTPVVSPGDSVYFTFTQLANISNSTTNDIIHNIKVWVNWLGDNVHTNDTIHTTVSSFHSPLSPITASPVSIPYASSVSLTASSPDSIYWYGDPLLTNLLTTGNNYTTGLLYNNSNYYVIAKGNTITGLHNIGNGNVLQKFAPAYAYFKYGWSSFIYDANEIQNSGMIDSISFYVQNNTNISIHNQQLYLSHTNMTTHPNTSYPGVSGKSKVWDGTLSINTSGWHTIALDTPFYYNGIDNLLVYWENHNGSYSIGYPIWMSSPISGKTIYKFNDNTFPSSSGISLNKRPNIQLTINSKACSSPKASILVNITSQPPIDVGVLTITSPTTQVYLSNGELVKIRVKNFGLALQSNIPVAYKINNDPPIWDTINTSIAPGTIYDFTFTQTADLSANNQTYNLKVFTALSGDNTFINDTALSTVICLSPNYCNSSATITSNSDIGNFTFAGINNNSTPNYDKLYTNFTSVMPALITPNGSFPISITINSALTYGNNGYLKVFIDYNRNGIYEPATETAFSHAYGTATSTTPVVVTGIVNVPATALNGITQLRVVAKDNATASTVNPCGTYFNGETEDYSIMINTPIAQDAGVISILSPTEINYGSFSPLNVVIKNYGTQSFDTVYVNYVLNGVTPVTIQHIASIAPNATSNVSFGNISLQNCANSLCVYTSLSGDINSYNNQICASPFREPTVNLSYTDSFEGNDLWHVGTNCNQWERGIPQMTNINSAHSSTNVWATNLNGNYLSNSLEYLYSPIIKTTNLDSATLKFWHYYNTQANDGCQLQVLIAGTWTNLGYIGDPNATAWYNTNMTGPHFWSGNSNGWIQSTYKMDFNAFPFVTSSNPNPPNSLQFRFYFQSNNIGTNTDGWAIDDFEILLPIVPLDARPSTITNPLNNVQIGDTITISFEVKNTGGSPITTSFPVYYKINGGTNITETFIPTGGALAPNAIDTFSFTTTFIAPPTSFTLCVGTNMPGDQYPQNDEICKTLNVTAANIDAGIIAVSASPSCNDTTSIYTHPAVVVTIKNFGLNTLTSIPIKYTINGGTSFINETWTGNLTSGNTINYTFNNTYTSTIGNYLLCASTSLLTDINPVNNKKCHSYTGATCSGDGIENSNGYMFSVEQNKPNPAYGITHINYVVPHDGKIVFEFKNALGQLVYTKKSNAKTGSNKITIDANKFANGVYFYTIHFNKQRITRRFIVNN